MGQKVALRTGWRASRLSCAGSCMACVGWRQLSGLSTYSLVNEGGVSCYCWAEGNCFQLSRGGVWREDGCRGDVALLSKHLLVAGVGGSKKPLSLLWQLLWWPCKLSVMLLPIPSLPGWCLCAVWWPWLGSKGPSPRLKEK